MHRWRHPLRFEIGFCSWIRPLIRMVGAMLLIAAVMAAWTAAGTTSMLVAAPPDASKTPSDSQVLEAADDYSLNEYPARPEPDWVRMIDQGERHPALAGLRTPAGIRVEIVAQEPAVIDPVDLEFDADGNAYVIEWRHADGARHASYVVKFQDGSEGVVNRMTKPVNDVFKRLIDSDGDGRWDAAELLMTDLEIPSMALVRDGWVYLPGLGKVVRRRQSQSDGPFDVQEEILRGLCGFHHHQASGLTISHDGWMFISSGDDDNRAEGRDGTRATVLRTGAIFRSRPDGTQVHEFARGFRNPYRNVAFDHLYNMFHVDNDQEDGSKFQGVRLMHILEGSDFGWRLLEGAVCCRTDFARGAVMGEKPGMSPSMLKTGRGAPAGLLIYQGTQFPEFFRGLLIYPDVFRKRVRAYEVEPDGTSFKVVRQFTLMESDDGLFRPCEAVVGPDGAIYIVDWATDSGGAGRLWGDSTHGRIYRLSWSGIDGHPAIPLAPRDSWARVRQATDAALWELLDGPDFRLRERALDELVARGQQNAARFVDFALDRQRTHTLPGRAAAIGGAARFYRARPEETQAAMVQLLGDPSHDLRRLAADAISRHASVEHVDDALLSPLTAMVQDRGEHPAARRAAALALGNLAGMRGGEPALQAAGAILSAFGQVEPSDAHLRIGLARGFERCGRAAILQVAAELSTLTEAAQAPRREAIVALFECFRGREAAAGLDAILNAGAETLDDERLRRLITAYRNILVEPPISPTTLIRFAETHPDASPAVQIAALESIGLCGGAQSEALARIARSLLEHDDPATRIAAAQAIGAAGVNTASGALVAALQDVDRSLAERQELLAALGRLRSMLLPFNAQRTPPGVETVTEELAAVVADPRQGELRTQALALLAQVDYAKAEPQALVLLDSEDVASTAAAIGILAARPERATEIGRRFLDGRIHRSLLPQVAEALRRHVEKDASGEFARLLSEVFRGGLLVSLNADEIARIENLVAMRGDPQRGKQVYLSKTTQCAQCHKLEGYGGQVGPDLSKVWQTHTVARLMESIIDPSKEIKEGFATWLVQTDEGQVYKGLKISENSTETVLREPSGKDVRIPADKIELKEESKASLMPEGAIAQLSFDQFVDLIAFLKSREVQETLANEAGANDVGGNGGAAPK